MTVSTPIADDVSAINKRMQELGLGGAIRPLGAPEIEFDNASLPKGPQPASNYVSKPPRQEPFPDFMTY